MNPIKIVKKYIIKTIICESTYGTNLLIFLLKLLLENELFNYSKTS
jgi:hypothetical protein